MPSMRMYIYTYACKFSNLYIASMNMYMPRYILRGRDKMEKSFLEKNAEEIF